LFLLVLLGNAVNLILLATAAERRSPRRERPKPAPSEGRRRENGFLRRLVSLNLFNGIAIGLTSPLMAYWFARRFHVGPAAIGPVLAATFAVTGIAALVVGRMTRQVGVVRAVVVSRSGGLLLLLLLPLAPTYWLAGLLYILRSAFNRGTAGARQALVVGAVDDQRRGFAISLNALSMQLPQSVGPAVAGALIGAGWFATPFYLAAALQGIYLWCYGRMFGKWETEG
jgi:MFS family permease